MQCSNARACRRLRPNRRDVCYRQKPLYYVTVYPISVNAQRPNALDEKLNTHESASNTTRFEKIGRIGVLHLTRPDKRNAVNEDLVTDLENLFSRPPEDVDAIVITGDGGHYCAGLDLAEHEHRSAEDNLYHSRRWHSIMDTIEFGNLPVISAMTGAVIGGGLEIASSTHIRVADSSAFFQLPEGRRGIFVGGGATVRVGRLIGPDRMREMMLTGRKFNATEGYALGLCHYTVDEGESLNKAMELAERVAANAPFSNYLMLQAIGRIGDMSRSDGLFTESLAAAMSQTTDGAAEGLRAFLEKRPPKFR